MRQIHVCAWLTMMALLAPACGGDQFTTADPDSDSRGSGSAGKSFAPPTAGESSDVDVEAPSTGGKGSGGGGAGHSGSGASYAGDASSGGDGDTTGSAGASGEDCVMGAVKLRMLPSSDLPKDYLCDAGCGTGWLTITDSYGAAAFSIFPACGSTSCESCSATPCAAAACLPTPLTAQGSELIWTGTHMAQDTCGMNQGCLRPSCVPPGRYRAKACAAVSAGTNDAAAGSCMPKDAQLCAEVEFEFPSDSTVELVLKKQQ